jgi:hypothetical protein
MQVWSRKYDEIWSREHDEVSHNFKNGRHILIFKTISCRFGRSGAGQKSIMVDEDEYLRAVRAGNVMRFGRSNPMRFGKRSSPQEIASSSRIYCEDGKCLIQQKENRLIDDNDKATFNNGEYSKDQLNSLFGDDAKQQQQQGYGEYVLTK